MEGQGHAATQAAWPQQQEPHHAALQATAAALVPHAGAGAPAPGDLPAGSEPVLPAPEDLRVLVSEGKSGSAAACSSGTLGHVMLVRSTSRWCHSGAKSLLLM
jgi:hypothetical protein